MEDQIELENLVADQNIALAELEEARAHLRVLEMKYQKKAFLVRIFTEKMKNKDAK